MKLGFPGKMPVVDSLIGDGHLFSSRLQGARPVPSSTALPRCCFERR
jgi:hypothetical protein